MAALINSIELLRSVILLYSAFIGEKDEKRHLILPTVVQAN